MMKKSAIHPSHLIVLVTTLILITTSAALASKNSLLVHCVDQAGNPVSGSKVFIQLLEGGKWKNKKVNKRGEARLKKLDDGLYRVVARKEGFVPKLHEFVRLSGDSEQSITLQLEPGDSTKEFYFENQSLAQKATDSLRQGISSLNSGRFKEAEKHLNDSLEIYPSNSQTYLYLALAHIQQHQWKPAEEALSKTLEFSKMFLESPQQESATKVEMQIQQNAEQLVSKLPALKLRAEGDDQLSKRNYEAATAKYKATLELLPDDPDTYYNLALAEGHAEQYDTAIQSVEKAIELKSGVQAYYELKNQLTKRKENAALRKAQGILEQGKKLFQGGDYGTALEKFQEARQLMPEKKQAVAWSLAAQAHAQLNHSEEAIRAFEKAMELDPKKVSYHKDLADYYLQQKQYDKALNVYADPTAAGSQPVDQLLFSLAKEQAKHGNSKIAQLAYERALQANPQNAEIYYELGMVYYYDRNDAKRATEMLNKYLEIGRDKGHLENTKSVLVVIKRNP